MNGIEIFLAFLGAAGTVCAILFGYIAFHRNNKSDHAEIGRKDGVLLTEIGYIKAGIDRIESRQDKFEQRQDKQDIQYLELVQRITALEQSDKSAHHRIDRLEGKETKT